MKMGALSESYLRACAHVGFHDARRRSSAFDEASADWAREYRDSGESVPRMGRDDVGFNAKRMSREEQ